MATSPPEQMDTVLICIPRALPNDTCSVHCLPLAHLYFNEMLQSSAILTLGLRIVITLVEESYVKSNDWCLPAERKTGVFEIVVIIRDIISGEAH